MVHSLLALWHQRDRDSGGAARRSVQGDATVQGDGIRMMWCRLFHQRDWLLTSWHWRCARCGRERAAVVEL